jgi:AcrR family transcriptional regulator
MANEVLRQIEAGGIDCVRIGTIAENLEVGVGTLYRRWGGREAMLEHTWRVCVGSIAHEVDLLLNLSISEAHTVERLWDMMVRALPTQLDAFFELHAARRRWVRFDQDFAFVIPGLIRYVELCQRLGHFRAGPPYVLASHIWWVVMGSLSGPTRGDVVRHRLGLHALKRLLLTPERLGDEEIEAIEITEAPGHVGRHGGFGGLGR